MTEKKDKSSIILNDLNELYERKKKEGGRIVLSAYLKNGKGFEGFINDDKDFGRDSYGEIYDVWVNLNPVVELPERKPFPQPLHVHLISDCLGYSYELKKG